MALDLDRIQLQGAGELDAAARDPGVRGLRGQFGWPAIISDAFNTGLPSAVTPPASIAARARARLSNRPRSTSSTSTRLRAEVSLWFLSVNVSPICVSSICVCAT